MPSYAKIMADALKEDKFDSSFSDGMAERFESMNNAQLSGIRQYLEPTVKKSQFKTWRDANAKVLNGVDGIMGPRLHEIQKEVEEETKIDDKAHDKFNRAIDKVAEKRALLDQTKRNAERTARRDVEEYEKKRKAEEKMAMMKQTPIAEEQRFQYIYGGCVFLICGNVLGVYFFEGLIMGLILAATFIGAIGTFVKAYYIGLVLPKVVTEEEVEEAVRIRAEEIFLKTVNTLKQKRRQHKAALATEKEYRRKMKQDEAERKAVEEAIMNADLDNMNQEIEIEEVSEVPLEGNERPHSSQVHLTHPPTPEHKGDDTPSTADTSRQGFFTAADKLDGIGMDSIEEDEDALLVSDDVIALRNAQAKANTAAPKGDEAV